MHEGGILKHALELVSAAAEEEHIHHVTEIKLVCGERRAILPESMQLLFCAFAKRSSLFKDCKLVLETREIVLKCNDCGRQFHNDVTNCVCIYCQDSHVSIVQGDELYIDYFSGEYSESPVEDIG